MHPSLLARPAAKSYMPSTGHCNSLWPTPAEAKLAKDDPPVAWRQCTRSCVASFPMASALGLPNSSCPFRRALVGFHHSHNFGLLSIRRAQLGHSMGVLRPFLPAPPCLLWEHAGTTGRAVPHSSHELPSSQPTSPRLSGPPCSLCACFVPVPALGRIYTGNSLLQVQKPHAFQEGASTAGGGLTST